MNAINPALLPAGLRDLLPPEAETEAAGVAAAMQVFASHAYRRVNPPLLEFEESFLGGSGAAVADQSFRIMDPDSHRMMVLRADITPQIARIAATRLAGAPRPLRLSYAGECVRVRPNGPGADRQVPQAGIELIGADSAAADAEVMLVAAEALAALGLARVSIDLTLPTLVPMLLEDAGLDEAARRDLSHALDRKDAAEVMRHGGPLAAMLTNLLLAAGTAQPALAALRAANLPPACRALAERLEQVAALVRQAAPTLRLTVDPVEFRGYRYHTGLALSIFAPGCPEELGRGGRYFSTDGEPATGITLYADAVLRAAGPRAERPTLFVPAGTRPELAAQLRAEGFATLSALEPTQDYDAEATRLRCSHVLVEGRAKEVTKGQGSALDPLGP
jgi:ATP phosphoribosyltransferase regulatory subunit